MSWYISFGFSFSASVSASVSASTSVVINVGDADANTNTNTDTDARPDVNADADADVDANPDVDVDADSVTVIADVDECDNDPGRCSGFMTQCVNRPGSYDCECEDGYEFSDIGQQHIPSASASQAFTLEFFSIMKYLTGLCVNADDCTEDACGDNSECIDLEPGKGYSCLCKEGYMESDGRCQGRLIYIFSLRLRCIH